MTPIQASMLGGVGHLENRGGMLHFHECIDPVETTISERGTVIETKFHFYTKNKDILAIVREKSVKFYCRFGKKRDSLRIAGKGAVWDFDLRRVGATDLWDCRLVAHAKKKDFLHGNKPLSWKDR